jgi:hypothetical protein
MSGFFRLYLVRSGEVGLSQGTSAYFSLCQVSTGYIKLCLIWLGQDKLVQVRPG